ncbi:MAG TPA: hypothetical protein VI033_01500 [Candidatus Nitrosopolaris sp.]
MSLLPLLPLVVPMVDSIQTPSDLVYCGDTIILSTSKALLELLIEGPALAPNGEPKFWVANAEFTRMLGNTKMVAAAITATSDIIFCVLFMLLLL